MGFEPTTLRDLTLGARGFPYAVSGSLRAEHTREQRANSKPERSFREESGDEGRRK